MVRSRNPETYAEILRLCKLLGKRCDLSKVRITTDISNSINQYVEEPDGSYKKRY